MLEDIDLEYRHINGENYVKVDDVIELLKDVTKERERLQWELKYEKAVNKLMGQLLNSKREKKD